MSRKREFFNEMFDWVRETKPTKKQIQQYKLKLCQKYKITNVPTDIEIYLNAPKEIIEDIKLYLQSKPTRTASGVAVIAMMTAPSLCPHGACIFCPGGLGSVYGDVPMSYTGKEPSTMRSIRNEYDPYRVIFNRLEQYFVLGQFPDKCEQIIQGGTFPSYDKKYQEEFVYYSFKAYNDFSKQFFIDGEFQLETFREFFELPADIHNEGRRLRIRDKILALKEQEIKSLEEEQVENETSNIRCIGLTIETKPDWGRKEHGLDFLRLGATRVELGVQTIYDDVLKFVNRGHTIEDTYNSIAELRDLAFKLNFHIMPGLPTPSGRVSREDDLKSLKEMFTDERFMPDMIKIYPCMVMPGTPLEKIWKEGKFIPLTTKEAADIIVESYKFVPEWCRIMRVQRDIPTYQTEAGVDKTNLRQYVDALAKERGIVERDIRAREIRGRSITEEPTLVKREYAAAGGKEIFLSIEANDMLLGFVRLRFPPRSLHSAITEKSALIRELHVYGQAVPIGKEEDKTQHKGYGRWLMEEAEKIATENGKDKIVVISGVGVREYYRKLGYEREGPYMVKRL